MINSNCDGGLDNKIGNLVLLGLSHKTAPVETRELLSLPESQIPAFYERLIEAGVGRLYMCLPATGLKFT